MSGGPEHSPAEDGTSSAQWCMLQPTPVAAAREVEQSSEEIKVEKIMKAGLGRSTGCRSQEGATARPGVLNWD